MCDGDKLEAQAGHLWGTPAAVAATQVSPRRQPWERGHNNFPQPLPGLGETIRSFPRLAPWATVYRGEGRLRLTRGMAGHPGARFEVVMIDNL